MTEETKHFQHEVKKIYKIANSVWKSLEYNPLLNFFVKRLTLSLIAASLLSLALTLRLHLYAHLIDIRIPLEGIIFNGYLFIYSTVSTFVLSLIFSGGMLINRRMVSSHAHQFKDYQEHKKHEKRTWYTLLIIVLAIFLYFLVNELQKNDTFDVVGALIGLFLMGSCFWVFYPRFEKLRDRTFYGIYGVCFLITLVSTLGTEFTTHLRSAGYGGGRIVSVLTNNEHSFENVGLILRSRNYVTLYMPKSAEFIEIPMSEITHIKYRTIKNLEEEFFLPSKTSTNASPENNAP